MFFFGTINSDVGSYLTLNLVECTGENCMSAEERATFLDDKEPYFTTVFNNQQYMLDEYDSDLVIERFAEV